MENSKVDYDKLRRFLTVGLILAACIAVPLLSPVAQRRSKEKPPKVTGITSQKTANGDVISLATDGALNGIQTWQDPNGSFHLVLPGSGESSITGSPKGVSVRRVGNSLEIEVHPKRGSNVTVEPSFNRLDLVVSGGIDSQPSAKTSNEASAIPGPSRRANAPLASNSPVARVSRNKASTKEIKPKTEPVKHAAPSMPVEKPSVAYVPIPTGDAKPVAAPSASTKNASSTSTAASLNPVPEAPESETEAPSGLASFWGFAKWVALLSIVVLVAWLIWRRRDNAGWVDMEEDASTEYLAESTDREEYNEIVGDRRQKERRHDVRVGGRRHDDPKAVRQPSSQFKPQSGQLPATQSNNATIAPVVLYGAYRVDQEVGKLVLGQPHRMDVLASRGADDRRSMEASLLKALRSSETSEDGRRKASMALEDYGFIARQSAAILLGRDACERAAAARVLAEVGSPGSLQFLLEALYDTDAVVRTQAVESIGALKLPSAIGALLDIARRYPDMPSSVLSDALNACSIDCLDIFDSTPRQSPLLLSGGREPFTSEITSLEPSASFKDLPASSEDEVFVETMALLQSDDADARAAAAQTLAIYRVQSSVLALKQISANDPEAAVRAAAVASLGAIDHESVFSTVLVGLADEARDVRAAAARAVSRLSFDRADAYARVIEMSDAQELGEVASACIKTGMATQALDRLSSDDRRQAYEAFSLLSLLAEANQCQPILDAIESHLDTKACLVAVQLLGLSSPPDLAPQLRSLASRDGMPEQLRVALMEVVDKIDQMQLA